MKTAYSTAIFLLLAISTANSAVVNVTCPHANDISPCECYHESAQIWCTGKDIDDLTLSRVSPNVVTEHGIFHLLLIRDTKVKSIEKHAFINVSFERIFIENNHDLTYIDPEAFRSGNVTLLVVQNNPELETNETFAVARHLKPSDSIEFNGNYFKQIPAEAFIGDPNTSTLNYLYLSNNTYNERIGRNAFLGHPRLRQLGLDNNNIHTIDDYGLNISAAVTLGHRLTVHLEANKLSSKSFNNNTIIIPRNVYATFHLENNLFTELSEECSGHWLLRDTSLCSPEISSPATADWSGL